MMIPLGLKPWRLSLLMVAVLALSACSPLSILNTVIGEDDLAVQSGISYGPEARQKLDVYRPRLSGGPIPVVIFFYGGSWRGGERADYLFVAEALTSRGYIAVVPDYRTFPEVRFPAFVKDGAKAVRWVVDNITSLGGDPKRLYLTRHSAGGHIASMLTLDERYLAAEGLDSHQLRGTIALAGPHAFYPSRTANVAPIFAHLADENEARPLVYVDGDEAPLLLLHGDDDDTVFPFNTLNLSQAVVDAGGRARHIIYPDIGHIEILFSLARPFRDLAPLLDDIAAFIDGQG